MEEKNNVFEIEAEYEKTILIIKEIIQKIVSIDINLFKEKIEYLGIENEYSEFIDLYNAVIGKKTNKYYFCLSEEDVKYYELELKKVYRISDLSADLQRKYSEEKQLELEARSILAEKLFVMSKSLKEQFSLKVGKSDGSLATLDSRIIKEQDVEFLDNLIKYSEFLIDKNIRLKVLIAEKDVYALEGAKEQYNKKSSIEKWFYKAFNREKSVIQSMANKNKEKK